MSKFLEQIKNNLINTHENAEEISSIDFIEAIRKLDKSHPSACGEGFYKKAYYLKPGYILLKSKSYKVESASIIKKANALKQMGVNIACPVFFTSEKDIHKFKGLFQSESHPIQYQVQEEAKGSHVRIINDDSLCKYFSAFNPNLNFKKLNREELTKSYNLQMAKHRAKTGLPHLKKFFTDYVILTELGTQDKHSENVYYSSKDGYKFFDLPFDFDFNENENFAEVIKQRLAKRSKFFEDHDYASFLTYSFGISKIDFTTKPNESNFSQYVYNGVLLFQYLKMLDSNVPENPNYNPLFPNARAFARKTIADFYDNKNTLRENVFAMDPKTLSTLEKALISNDNKVLKNIAMQYGFGKNFDFNCIDIPNFLETMQLSHTFDYKNPTPKALDTRDQSEHASLSISPNGDYDFGLV